MASWIVRASFLAATALTATACGGILGIDYLANDLDAATDAANAPDSGAIDAAARYDATPNDASVSFDQASVDVGDERGADAQDSTAANDVGADGGGPVDSAVEGSPVDAAIDGRSDACQSGMCGCRGATPNSCGANCTDIMADSSNCGSCGNSCPGVALGETCAQGRCQAYSVAASISPFALATDGVNVYYLNNDPGAGVGLASVPVAGGSVSGPVAVPGASTVATDGARVFWGGTASNGTGFLDSAPVNNLTNRSISIGVAEAVVATFADPSAGQLFFGQQCAGIGGVSLSTWTLVLGGPATGGCIKGAMVADSTQIYWANPRSALATGASLGVFGALIAGSFGTQLSGALDVQGVAVQGGFLYFTDAAGSTVSRVPTNGSTQATLIASASAPGGLVTDASRVYWIDAAGATIKSFVFADNHVTILATGQSANAIAEDGASLYWTNSNAIMRLPK